MKFSWSQPSCRRCFFECNPGQEPAALIVGMRDRETCVWCGRTTYEGVYVRVDPVTAPHPTRMKED